MLNVTLKHHTIIPDHIVCTYSRHCIYLFGTLLYILLSGTLYYMICSFSLEFKSLNLPPPFICKKKTIYRLYFISIYTLIQVLYCRLLNKNYNYRSKIPSTPFYTFTSGPINNISCPIHNKQLYISVCVCVPYIAMVEISYIRSRRSRIIVARPLSDTTFRFPTASTIMYIALSAACELRYC